MSQPKDTETLSPDELVLVDLLYGELEGEAAAAAHENIESRLDLASELAELRGLRAMMAELPDEEPPPALSAQLLHAAAKQAPAGKAARVAPVAESTGFFAWLKRLFEPMAMHPAMAAAATFLLVAGVAGALYVSGRVEVSEPQTGADKTGVVESPAVESSAEEAPTGKPGSVALPESRFDDDVVLDHEAAGDMPASGSAGSAERSRAAAAKAEQGSMSKSSSANRPALEKPAARPEPAGRGEIQSTGAAAYGQGQPQPPPPAKTKKRRASKKAPPQKAPGPVLKGNVSDVVIGAGLEDEAKPNEKAVSKDDQASRDREDKLAQARLLHQRAVQAARDGECDAVNEIGKRIRKLDSRYYDTVYLRDKSLYACRGVNPPNAE